MKYFFSLLGLLLCFNLFAQSVDQLEKQLIEASSTKEKVILYYQLGEAYLPMDSDKAIENGKKSYELANSSGDKGMAAQAAYLTALGYARKRKEDRNQEVWLKSALAMAKLAGDLDMVIKSVVKRSDLAMKDRNYRRAYEINQEAFEYLSDKGVSASELQRKYEIQKTQLDKQRRELEQEKERLEDEITNLTGERDQLSQDKTQLTAQQERLTQAKKKVEDEIAEKEEALVSISKEKQKAEKIAEQTEKELKQLTREALEQRAALESTRANLAEAELEATQNRNIRNLTILAAGFLLLLALLSYNRFRSSRKAKVALQEKNKIIEQERERSDELLLNILPGPIAEELKEYGKAKARRYEEATVLFTDFKNFTKISEQLTPEELVQELDNCFKAFDFIISQYPDIEKIKTVGDAYLCASGLSEESEPPVHMVRASLEMQEFLEEQKQEKMRLGKPFFEARIGIHTGPVVAGVVGVNKFAYDIWGDTVNIAARMESNSEPGRVNISEPTFQLIKEQYECEHRGKLHAKNKGLIDMYFVKGELAGVAV